MINGHIFTSLNFEKIDLDLPDIEFDEPPETVEENIRKLKEIKSMRKTGNKSIMEKTDTEKYLVIVFPSRMEKIKLLRKMHLSEDERYIPSKSVETNNTNTKCGKQ